MVGFSGKITVLLLVLVLSGSCAAIIQPAQASVENVGTSATITIYPEPAIAGQAITVVAQLYPPPPPGEVFANLTATLMPVMSLPPPRIAGPNSSNEKGVAWFTFNVQETGYIIELFFPGQYFANNTIYYQKGNWQKGLNVISDQTPKISPTTAPTASPTPSPTIPPTPPSISIISPENQTYQTPDIPLVFSSDKNIILTQYSLDGQQNITIKGSNTTITGLSNGAHSITIYANDTYGNIGNQTTNFTVNKPQNEIFGNTATIAAIAVPVAVICIVASLLIYRRHRIKKN
jgi:hypothetical protein